MWRVALMCIAIAACTPANEPTRTDTLFYDHFQQMLPAPFADAQMSLDWRGFNYQWRFHGVTTQCGARVFDLAPDAVAAFVRDAPEATSNPGETGWTRIGLARAAPDESTRALQARAARVMPLPAVAEHFCAMPEAEHRAFADRVAALWANDDTLFFVEQVHFGGGTAFGSDRRVEAHYYAVLDQTQSKLYVWFFATPPVG